MIETLTSVHKRAVHSIDGVWSFVVSLDMLETLTSVHKRVVDSIYDDWCIVVLLGRLKVCSGGIGLWVISEDLGEVLVVVVDRVVLKLDGVAGGGQESSGEESEIGGAHGVLSWFCSFNYKSSSSDLMRIASQIKIRA